MVRLVLRRRAPLAITLLLGAACARVGAGSALAGANPQRSVDELLAADRAFSAAAARAGGVGGIAAMLANDVWMPTSRGDFARGVAEVVDALRAGLGPGVTRLQWVAIRGGVSADGQHGFTFGYVTVDQHDTPSTPAKYLAYWVKGPAGWRVAAYKVGRRAEGQVSLATTAPSLPARLVQPTSDPETLDRHMRSLVAAERAFSDRAQRVGLGPAFVEFGRADAINLGGRDDAAFVVGNEAIAKLVGGSGPSGASPVFWSADRALVASSGDLGVTFGFIRQRAPSADGPAARGIPFFTIWRRGGPREPWRYIAE